MRRIDDTPIDPELTEELDAIDAALAGEPVDPRHAELAELALLLADERPRPSAEFAASLDQRVARRFASADTHPQGRRSRSWLAPAGALAGGVAAIVAAVIVIGSGGGSGLQQPQSLTARGAASATGTASTTASATTASGSAASTTASATTASATPAPTPLPNGRKIIQSAQLALEAPANRIDFVAQEVFRVMGRENGVVGSSNVTSGTGGYAQFQLSVPSSTLGATMSALSELSDASVISRTDATQDVNGQYLADSRKLADDRALRTSLLRQLAKATSQQQIDALKTQIRDAEASIRSDESTLRGLTHSIDFSQITVTINAAPAAPQHHSGAFTLSRAWHDAGRVLTIAAGVALITLAALVPLALLAAIGWWISTAVRRRRREQALDVV